MQLNYVAVVVMASVITVLYVHATIWRLATSGARRAVAHGVLLFTGLLFGAVSANVFGAALPPWLALAGGTDVVHLPAACVLFIRHLSESGES
ncbi:hypothetical protein [Paraburkholderia sp. XV]|uniref:hypothetical protein n=1 Tax=Paraburkholderia sp. XV TaxID=2831520 RepID=UPI001CD68BAB|nr:hypothetical protein [Paraburkholderia sp. XV]